MILPVVGLLLLLGLFWYWASSLIGDDGDTPATPSQQAIVLTQDPPTATATTEVVITPVETTEGGENGENNSSGGETTPPTPTPTEEAESTGGLFEVGDIIAVTDDEVRLRAEPSTSAEIVEEMTRGTELRVTGPPEEGDGFIWWPVEDEVTGNSGWVAQDFVEDS